MLLTVCTIAQLPQALTLGTSFVRHHPTRSFVIGLADDPAHLPASWSSPFPLLTLADAGLSAADVGLLSARYTPVEFRAACKPAFIRAAYQQTTSGSLLYADPSALVYYPLDELFTRTTEHSVLLNPHWLSPPADDRQPDEKHLQNVGLYSGGLIGFGRQPDTEAMLTWWQERTATHAHLDFCRGECLDQLWLMHTPALFNRVGIIKHVGLQVALWNMHERHLASVPAGWQVIDNNRPIPLLTADFLGLHHADEGLFPFQNRLQVNKRPDVSTLLIDYQKELSAHQMPGLSAVVPAYGQQPEPPLVRGWRRSATQRLRWLSDWINTVPVRPVHR